MARNSGGEDERRQQWPDVICWRTRGDIPWDVKVRHHLYFVPLAAGILLAWAAAKSNSAR